MLNNYEKHIWLSGLFEFGGGKKDFGPVLSCVRIKDSLFSLLFVFLYLQNKNNTCISSRDIVRIK
jgi:hypothetical protein